MRTAGTGSRIERVFSALWMQAVLVQLDESEYRAPMPSKFFFCVLSGFAAVAASISAADLRTIVVTNDLVLEKSATWNARLIVRASHVTIEGNGATLQGLGMAGDLKSLEEAGVGVLLGTAEFGEVAGLVEERARPRPPLRLPSRVPAPPRRAPPVRPTQSRSECLVVTATAIPVAGAPPAWTIRQKT
jgi:hypothetical protein